MWAQSSGRTLVLTSHWLSGPRVSASPPVRPTPPVPDPAAPPCRRWAPIHLLRQNGQARTGRRGIHSGTESLARVSAAEARGPRCQHPLRTPRAGVDWNPRVTVPITPAGSASSGWLSFGCRRGDINFPPVSLARWFEPYLNAESHTTVERRERTGRKSSAPPTGERKECRRVESRIAATADSGSHRCCGLGGCRWLGRLAGIRGNQFLPQFGDVTLGVDEIARRDPTPPRGRHSPWPALVVVLIPVWILPTSYLCV